MTSHKPSSCRRRMTMPNERQGAGEAIRISSNGEDQRRRRRRARPIPKWLLGQKDLDQIAQRRCLMVLSVLSGQVPVSEAIAEAQISRGTYYQLESRALEAMVQALLPGSPTSSPSAGELLKRRVEELLGKVG